MIVYELRASTFEEIQIMQRLCMLFILVVLLTGCAGTSPIMISSEPTPVPCQIQEYVNATNPIFSAWKDAVTLASNTQRINLPPQIEKLQSLRRDLQNVNVPECARTAQSTLLQGMDDTIHAYMDFLAQRDKDRVTGLLQLAKQYEDAFTAEQAKLPQIAAGQLITSTVALPLYEPVPVDKFRTAYETANYHMAQRSLADGRTALNGTKDGIAVELVVDQGNIVQVAISSDTATFPQILDTAKIAFPQGQEKEWEKAGAVGMLVGRTMVRWQTFGASKLFTIDLF